jgi:hypothetical protein
LTSIELLTLPSVEAEQPDRAAGGSRTLGTNWLIALVLLAFGVSHVIGANILSRSAAVEPSPSGISSVHTD